MATKTIARISIFLLVFGPAAWAKDLSSSQYSSQLSQASEQIQCSPDSYQNNDSGLKACNQCMQKIREDQGTVQKASDSGMATDSSLKASGSSSAASAAANTGQVQKGTAAGANAGSKAGSQTNSQRATNDNTVASAFDQCSQDLKSACQSGLVGQDQQAASSAQQACQGGSSDAKSAAADNAGSSSDMSQMAQTAGQLAQALGPLAQMLAGQNSASATNTDTGTDTAALADTAPVASTNLATGASSTPNVASFGSPTSSAKAASTAATALPSASTGGLSSPLATSETTGSSYGGGSGGGYGGSGSPSTGAAAGAAGGNSTGASMFDPTSVATATSTSPYEMASSSGGSTPRAMIGLKGQTGLDDSGGANVGSLNGLPPLGDIGGDRAPASVAQNSSDIQRADGSSLFNVVRSKLVEIKKRGNI